MIILGGGIMKIVVSAKGHDLDSEVDPRFGRAVGFILFDTETHDFMAVDNSQTLNTPSGAGIQAAETVSRLNADALITGHCGPKAFRTLQAAGIAIYTGASGTVSAALEAWEQKKLTEASGADVESHWV
jgi:predicted Fe-Mo cluster-binding NifX family protein